MFKLRLNRSGYRQFSVICVDIAQVFFGVAIGGGVLTSLDISKLIVLISELAFALGFWYLSVYFAEKGKI